MRGDIVTVADRGGEFTGKPRPAIVLQADLFAEAATIVIVPISTVPADAPLLRIPLRPGEATGLAAPCWAQLDLVTAVRRRRIGPRIGRVDDATLITINRALTVLLGLA